MLFCALCNKNTYIAHKGHESVLYTYQLKQKLDTFKGYIPNYSTESKTVNFIKRVYDSLLEHI